MINHMSTAPRDGTEIIVWQSGLRFIAVYDDDSGFFFADQELDGLPTSYVMELPGRLYAPSGWQPTG